MALFDISGIVSDLNTIISGLTLSTEEEDRLTTLLKAAVNLGEDPTTIISELQSRIEAIDNTVLLEKFAILVGALSASTTDRIVSIATVNDLQDLTTDPLPSGSIFFVDSIGVEVVSVGTKWLGLDGRVLRDDTVIIDAMGWGRNQLYGEVGDGTQTPRSSPVTVVGGIINWSAVAAADAHSHALTDTGVIYSWGLNTAGRLGDGTGVTYRSSPVTVVGGITNWSAISSKVSHSHALTDEGILYSWGFGAYGKLGDGTTVSKSSPVTVAGDLTWSSISAGVYNGFGITDAGILYGWGYGFVGVLGDGTTVSKSSPVTVAGGITNWSAVSAGWQHVLALTDTGIIYSWGSRYYGKIGDGTTVSKSSPVTVIGGITNWSAVAASQHHSLGLTDTSVLYAWGRNNLGQLGDGTTSDKSSPITVISGITNWSQIATGEDHSFGITDTGILYAWGDGEYGKLGDGTTVSKSSPVTVAGGITSWSAVDGGRRHSLGLK